MISMRVEIMGIEKLLADLGRMPRAMPRVLTRAINRTVDSAKTKVVRKLAATLNTTRKELLDKKRGKLANVMVDHAKAGHYSGRLFITGRRISLGKFGPRPAAPGFGAQRKLPGSSAQIFRSGGRKTYDHAFTARLESGHVGLFKRKGAKRAMTKGHYVGQMRQPIVELRGPSVPAVVENINEIASRTLSQEMQTALAKNIQTQVELVLIQKTGGG